ncbi:MAG: hypothetical protein JO337_12740, partial [Acidimicrobiales bacterium]|nr:hypothetical protein [Acidimicrobiales bacterium]
VKLAESDSLEAHVVRRYVNMIQKERGELHGRMLPIRAEDLKALGRFFERDEAAMEIKLAELGLHY